MEEIYILEAESIRKEYKDSGQSLVILSEISIGIREKKITAITGPSGSGKSTLLHLLGFLDAPDRGIIKFKGQPVQVYDKNTASLRNKAIGFVFQFHYLLDDFTALENVAIPLLLGNTSKKVAFQQAQALLEEVGLAERANHYPNQLSGGEQQRVAIARALANNPEVVLADEPTGNLDQKHSEEIMALLQQLHLDKGISLVLVTHDEAIALRADHHFHLQYGELNQVR